MNSLTSIAILASVLFGAADFLGGLATTRAPTYSVVVVSQAAGVVLLAIALPLLPAATIAPADLLWGAAAGCAGGIGVALLYRGLASGPMSVVAPVTAVCAVIVPVIAGLWLGERPSAVTLAGIGLAVVAVALAGQSVHAEDLTIKRPGTGMPPSCISMLIGRQLAVDIAPDTILTESHFVAEAKKKGRLHPRQAANVH